MGTPVHHILGLCKKLRLLDQGDHYLRTPGNLAVFFCATLSAAGVMNRGRVAPSKGLWHTAP